MESERFDIPVFVNPQEMKFLVGSFESQTMRIFNPYKRKVEYQVLCTAPSRYRIAYYQGTIEPMSVIDVPARHTNPISSYCNLVDRFRIKLIDHESKREIGQRDVKVHLCEENADDMSENEIRRSFRPSIDRGSSERTMRSNSSADDPLARRAPSHYFKVIGFILCIACLFIIPTAEQSLPETNIPKYFHATSSFKLMVSFVAGGLFTMLLQLQA